MPWDDDNDRFESPLYDSPPLGFMALNALKLLYAEQDRAIAWWNSRWSSVINHSLVRLDEKLFKVGTPLDFNSRALHAVIINEVAEKDNYQDESALITFVYLSGDAQLASTEAWRYAPAIVASYYLKMFASILQTAPSDKLTAGWPADGRPANIVKFLSIERPDTRLIPEEKQTGVQAVLNLKLLINPYHIDLI